MFFGTTVHETYSFLEFLDFLPNLKSYSPYLNGKIANHMKNLEVNTGFLVLYNRVVQLQNQQNISR